MVIFCLILVLECIKHTLFDRFGILIDLLHAKLMASFGYSVAADFMQNAYIIKEQLVLFVLLKMLSQAVLPQTFHH